MTKFSDIMFSDLTSDQLRSLPPGYSAAWRSRPTRAEIARSKKFMYVRVALIAAAAIYLYSRPSARDFTFLVAALIGYEIAYYTLRKEKCENDYSMALERYADQARELDGEA